MGGLAGVWRLTACSLTLAWTADRTLAGARSTKSGHYVNLDRGSAVPSVPMSARVGVLVKYARSFGA
jgi:hypothetical protein